MAFSFNQQQPSPLQQQTSAFSFPQTTSQPQQQQQFGFQQSQQQPQYQQQQQQHLYLFTNDKTPATYSTKWADLHPDSQKVLLQIEEKIFDFRDESQRLDQCSRLYDSSVSNGGFELDTSRINQELGGVGTGMERQKAICQELMSAAKDILRNTEVAVRSFMMMRPRFLHPHTGGAPPSSNNQPNTNNSIVPVFDFYSGLPKKPSPFLQQTISRFEKYIVECRQWIEELEQLILLDSERNSSLSLLQSLPKVMSNVHDFFVHVAAKVESIHQHIESMKGAYLADQRRRGYGNDPFVEADRRETAKQEAAAKRVHPSLHLPPSSQQPLLLLSQSQGVVTTSAAAPTSTPASASLLFTPTPPVAATSASPLGQNQLFTPSPASATTTSLFTSTTPFQSPFATGGATAGSGTSFNVTSKNRGKSRTSRR